MYCRYSNNDDIGMWHGIPVWNARQKYHKDEVVVLNNNSPTVIFISIQDHNSNKPAIGKGWDLVHKWRFGSIYSKGDIVYQVEDGNIVYMLSLYDKNIALQRSANWHKSFNAIELIRMKDGGSMVKSKDKMKNDTTIEYWNHIPIWNANERYVDGKVVKLNGDDDFLYLSRFNSNRYHPHDNSYWVGIPKWNPDVFYNEGCVVFFIKNKKVIFCRSKEDCNNEHCLSAKWIASTNIKVIMDMPGEYDDSTRVNSLRNLDITPHSLPIWNPNLKYDMGDMVVLNRHGGVIYLNCVKGTSGHKRSPTNSEFWLPIYRYEYPFKNSTVGVFYFHTSDTINTMFRKYNNFTGDYDQSESLRELLGIDTEDDLTRLINEYNTIVKPELDRLAYGGSATNVSDCDIAKPEPKSSVPPQLYTMFYNVKSLYKDAIDVETKKRGHSESSRIEKRWGNELLVIGELIEKGQTLPYNTEQALDKVHKELLDYVKSAGVYIEAVNSYVDVDMMIDVMLHPAK